MSPTDHAAHNRGQVEYFSDRDLPRMTVDGRGDTPYVAHHVDRAAAAIGLGTEDRVLDVGCGPGKFTVALARRLGDRVEGLDLTPQLVDALRAVAPGLRVHLGDVTAPPEELHGRFDAVTGFFMLHHVDDLDAAFRGVATVLRPGGRAVFVEPNPLFPGYYVQIAATPGMTWAGDGGIVRMRPQLLRAAATAAGFTDVVVDRYGLLPPALHNRPAFAAWERRLERVPGWRPLRAFQLVHARLP